VGVWALLGHPTPSPPLTNTQPLILFSSSPRLVLSHALHAHLTYSLLPFHIPNSHASHREIMESLKAAASFAAQNLTKPVSLSLVLLCGGLAMRCWVGRRVGFVLCVPPAQISLPCFEFRDDHVQEE
jgi:hypothetical protein